MPDDQTMDGGFKVVDRRPFAIDGTRRDETAETEKNTEPGPAKLKAEAEPGAQPKAEDQTLDEGFAMLVEFLANNAFFHLGLVAGPSGQAPPADLPSARAMIDLLSVVEDKSRGNLSPLESKLLGEALFELRTRFVQAQKQPAPKRK
ncbi:MAG: DUF1844 domain-containing protein [Terriglobia bacterium]